MVDLLERGVLALEGEVSWQHRYELGDPFYVVARKQERRKETPKQKLEALFGDRMSEDQSDLLEDYLMIWYEYQRSYVPNLGAPRMSVYCRYHKTSEVSFDDDDDLAEERWRKGIAETVEACVDELTPLQKSAIGIHCAARATGASVIRNPRMSIEEHHQQYQAAKQAIFWMPRMRDLMR